MTRATDWACLLLLLCGPGAGRLAADEPREVPFPTTRTVVVRDTEVTYVVDGRQTIPPGVEVTGQKGIRIAGRNGGVLVVEGALVIHGVSGLDVQVSGVRIEPAAEVKQLHLDHCVFTGSPVATPEGATTSGMITIENCKFEGASELSLDVTSGKVKLMSIHTARPVVLRGQAEGERQGRLYVMIHTSRLSGARVENVTDLTVRTNVLSGTPLLFRDNQTLLFDGNRVEGGPLVFEQTKAGRFRKTTFTKCDLLCSTVRFFAPATPGKGDRVVLDKCWFAGETDAKAIAKIVEDREDDPQNNVQVTVKKPLKRRLGLAGD